MRTRLHIIGAGLSGLACAVAAAEAGLAISLYEAAPRAGGRCRSFHDAAIDRLIDNGNHIILGGNRAAFGYLNNIGATDRMLAVEPPGLPFVDLRRGARWRLAAGWRAVPALLSRRHGPGGDWRELARLLRLVRVLPAQNVADLLGPDGALYECVWAPLAASVLNTAPDAASARLLRAVLVQTLLRGGAASRPFIARRSLSDAFIDPALDWLGKRGTTVRFGQRVSRLAFDAERLVALHLGEEAVTLGSHDAVVLAVPPAVANALMPGLGAPEESCAIVNAHYRVDAAHLLPATAPLLGMIGGTAEWLFVRGDVVSVTVSAADTLASRTNEAIAEILWADVAAALDLPCTPLPPVRVIKERRATPAQTPQFAVSRSHPETPWPNLWLAGDWTDTGLPATIESAIASGQRAGHLALAALAGNTNARGTDALPRLKPSV